MLALGAVALVACQPEPGSEITPPMPTPFPEVVTTPAFRQWVIDRTIAFRELAPIALPLGFGVQIEAYPRALSGTVDGAYSLLISSAEPPADWFVTPLGWEPIVLAVHPENGVRELGLEQLQEVFSGQLEDWEQLEGRPMAIEPVIPLEGDELRQQLAATLMEGRPFTPAALLGPTPELTLAMIAERQGAIGVLPLSAVTSAVRPLIVEGAAPQSTSAESGAYPLRVELLAAAPQEPRGQVREWLVWLQSEG